MKKKSQASQPQPPPPSQASPVLPQASPAPALKPQPRLPAATECPTHTVSFPERPPTLALAPATPESSQLPACLPQQQTPAPLEAQALPATAPHHNCRRRGRIARLPKIQRDMVGNMVRNAVPYKNIALALGECGYTITERNISNWVTRGGYLEWQLQQDLVLQNRLDQDHLVAHLRRDDASELAEVGFQSAATRLSQIFLQKLAKADDVERNLPAFSQMVDMLCRLNREICALQKQRDDARRSLGPEFDPARIKEMDEGSAIAHERYYSDPPAESELAKPKTPPLLPAEPTSDFLAQQDREAEEARKAENELRLIETLKRLSSNNTAPPTDTSP